MKRYSCLEDIYLDLDIEKKLVLFEDEIPIFRMKGKNDGLVRADIHKGFAAVVGLIDNDQQITKVIYSLDDLIYIEAKKCHETHTNEKFWMISDKPIIVSEESHWIVYIRGIPESKNTIKLLGYYSFNPFFAQKLQQNGKLLGKIWKNDWAYKTEGRRVEFFHTGITFLYISDWFHDNGYIKFQ